MPGLPRGLPCHLRYYRVKSACFALTHSMKEYGLTAEEDGLGSGCNLEKRWNRDTLGWFGMQIVKPDTEPWTGAAQATKDEKAVMSVQLEVVELRKLIQQRQLVRVVLQLK